MPEILLISKSKQDDCNRMGLQRVYIHKHKRNLTHNKMVAPSLLTKISLSDKAIAKYRYMPCIQYQNQTTEAYDW